MKARFVWLFLALGTLCLAVGCSSDNKGGTGSAGTGVSGKPSAPPAPPPPPPPPKQ